MPSPEEAAAAAAAVDVALGLAQSRFAALQLESRQSLDQAQRQQQAAEEDLARSKQQIASLQDFIARTRAARVVADEAHAEALRRSAQENASLQARLESLEFALENSRASPDGAAALEEAQSRLEGLVAQLSQSQGELRTLRAAHEAALDAMAAHENALEGERNHSRELEQALAELQVASSAQLEGATSATKAMALAMSAKGQSEDEYRESVERARYDKQLEGIKASYDETIANMTAQFQTSLTQAQTSYSSAATAISAQMQTMSTRMQEQAAELNQLRATHAAVQAVHAMCIQKAQTGGGSATSPAP